MRTLQEDLQVFVGQALQHMHGRARQERGVHLERRVLGGRAEEDDVAVLDVREHDVLLSLVEAMDLIDEQDGPLIGEPAQLARLFDELAQLRHPAGDGGHSSEPCLRMLRADRRERRLARAGRPPEDHRRQLSCVDRLPQDAALADDVLLPDELVEVARSHPSSERLRLGHCASDCPTATELPLRDS